MNNFFGNHMASPYFGMLSYLANDQLNNELIISDRDFRVIMQAIGYPLVDLVEDEFLLTVDQVKNDIILYGLQDYYRWFPKVEKVAYNMDGSKAPITIPYLDNLVYGIVDGRFTPYSLTHFSSSGGTSTGNPFIDMRGVIMSEGGNIQGSLGKNLTYGNQRNYYMESVLVDSQENFNRAYYVDDMPENREVIISSATEGTIELTWARYSNNFNDIPFIHKRDVQEYCEALVKIWYGRTINMSNPDLPVAIDADQLLDDGTDIVEKIVTKWKQSSGVVALR